MTLPYPRRAFANAHAVRHVRRPALDRDKLSAVAITIVLHALILAAALTAVHVARPRVLQELSVSITPEKIQVAQDTAPKSRLAAPSAVAVPPPEVMIETPAPPTVTVQQTAPSQCRPRRWLRRSRRWARRATVSWGACWPSSTVSSNIPARRARPISRVW